MERLWSSSFEILFDFATQQFLPSYRDGQIVGEGWNLVLKSNDPTAHAEVSAIRDACGKMGTFSLKV